jgi:hypothetical protein
MTDRLDALRQQIDDLTDPDGDYAVVCPDSGTCPDPVRGASFPTVEAAEEAAILVCDYRRLLREVDPHLECVPIVATERTPEPPSLDGAAPDARLSESVTLSGEGEAEWLRMDDAPVVTVREDGTPLPDDAVERQLRAKL